MDEYIDSLIDDIGNIDLKETYNESNNKSNNELKESINIGKNENTEPLTRIQIDPYDYDEIRIGMLGNVDAGKSTITGVLVKNVLDDGRGSVRKHIMRYPHEIERGQTSSVVQHHIRQDSDGKIISFTDLAGHEKYLKTTIGGIKRCFIEYAALVIAANKGIPIVDGKGTKHMNMTKEHISIINSINLPAFIILTKIDMVDKSITLNAIQSIKDYYNKKKMDSRRKILLIKGESDLELVNAYYQTGDYYKPLPIFPVSAVTGKGIDVLKKYIMEYLVPIKSYVEKKNEPVKFIIDCKYMVQGIGRVVSGLLTSGSIHASSVKGQNLKIGPIQGKYYNVKVGTIHNNFRENIPILYAGQSGCLQLKSNEIKLSERCFNKGTVITQTPKLIKEFKAEVKILTTHHTTIQLKYQPTINCEGISQCARVKNITNIESSNLKNIDKNNCSNNCSNNSEIDTNVSISGGDRAIIHFEFINHPEPLEVNSILVFREGKTRGIGKVIETY